MRGIITIVIFGGIIVYTQISNCSAKSQGTALIQEIRKVKSQACNCKASDTACGERALSDFSAYMNSNSDASYHQSQGGQMKTEVEKLVQCLVLAGVSPSKIQKALD